MAELSGEKPKTVKQWLSRQAFWQVHLPAPKQVDRPRYQVTTPNEMHQFDLLYMPSDTFYGNKYKYILAGIDAASRHKVVRPLRTKQARDVAEMIADIYKVGPLTYPKLREYNKEKPKFVKQWLSQQAFWQVHLPAPAHINRPHYQVKIPNEMHQFDLLYMPSDSLYGSKYKYILAGIDATSRYKVARPLRTKQAHVVPEMFADIYKVGPLMYPSTFQCDNGSKFKGEVTKMLEKQEVKIK